jgi:hypothetical protein
MPLRENPTKQIPPRQIISFDDYTRSPIGVQMASLATVITTGVWLFDPSNNEQDKLKLKFNNRNPNKKTGELIL